MNIGLIDVDGHNFPSLTLMKLSAWHKQHVKTGGDYQYGESTDMFKNQRGNMDMQRLTQYFNGYAHGAAGRLPDHLIGSYCRGEFEAAAVSKLKGGICGG